MAPTQSLKLVLACYHLLQPHEDFICWKQKTSERSQALLACWFQCLWWIIAIAPFKNVLLSSITEFWTVGLVLKSFTVIFSISPTHRCPNSANRAVKEICYAKYILLTLRAPTVGGNLSQRAAVWIYVSSDNKFLGLKTIKMSEGKLP